MKINKNYFNRKIIIIKQLFKVIKISNYIYNKREILKYLSTFKIKTFMAETFSFFEEGIKSYINQSISKYSENPEVILKAHFDNKFLNPLFINDITLFKNLIQKNKLKNEIWKSLGEVIFQKLNDVLVIFENNVSINNNKIPKYEEKIRQY